MPGDPRRAVSLRRWLVVAALAGLLLGEGLLSLSDAQQPCLLIQFSLPPSDGAGTSVEFQLRAPHGALPAHLGLVQGRTTDTANRTLDLWLDTSYPPREAAPDDLLWMEQRIGADLKEFGSPLRVNVVDTPTLLTVLRQQPNAMIALLGGATLPEALLAGPAPLLPTWVQDGGTVFWGGTPLGFYDGQPRSNGSGPDEDLGWQGQQRLLGYPLEDPLGDPSRVAEGPLYANQSSAYGAGLDLSYVGTADGANVTEVTAHGGDVLGYVDRSAQRPGEAPRTSLAYVPLGRGGIYYFGGAVWTSGLGSVPLGDLALSDDIALLAGLGFVPSGGWAASEDVEVGADQSVTATMTVPPGIQDVVALALTEISGNILAFKATEILST